MEEQNVRDLLQRLFGSKFMEGVGELSPEYLEIVDQAITTGLEPEHRRIIELNFGLSDGQCWTIEECARELGRPLIIVKRMKTSALVGLKYQLRSQLENPF